MKIEREVSASIAEKFRQVIEERAQLEARRHEALATAFEIERELAAVNRLVEVLIQLEVKDANFPAGAVGYEMTRDGRLIAEVPEVPGEVSMVNGHA